NPAHGFCRPDCQSGPLATLARPEEAWLLQEAGLVGSRAIHCPLDACTRAMNCPTTNRRPGFFKKPGFCSPVSGLTLGDSTHPTTLSPRRGIIRVKGGSDMSSI